MHDREIRQALRKFLESVHAQEPNTLIIEEIGICQGHARADMAVVNGALNGYEIKSERDTLERLPHQREVYGRCFDMMTLVAATKHLDKAADAVPSWWGILEAVADGEAITLRWLREPQANAQVAAETIVQLLWKKEALSILADLGLDKGLRSKSRKELWEALTRALPLDELRDRVREKLKSRQDWRSGVSPFRGGDSSRLSAKSQHSQTNRLWLLSRKSPNLHS